MIVLKLSLLIGIILLNTMEKHKVKGFYEAYFKRLIDIVASCIFILFFWWLYVIVAILVRINLGSPVIFTQERTGKHGKNFKIYKFRSMNNEKDENGNLLPGWDRVTKFGKILRSTSLDEIPELFNILKGDMSLVGPRPLPDHYSEHFNSFEKRRFEARPGLTGLAQVSGRAALSWKEKFEKDIEYVDHLSFLMDVKIILLTVKKVFVREGVEFKEGNQTIIDYFETHDKD